MAAIVAGFIFAFVDITFNIGFLKVGLLPAFAGLILILVGSRELEKNFLKKSEKMVFFLLIVVLGTVYFCTMFWVMPFYSVSANFIALCIMVGLLKKVAYRLDKHLSLVSPDLCDFHLASALTPAAVAVILIALLRVFEQVLWVWEIPMYIGRIEPVFPNIMILCAVPMVKTLWNMYDIMIYGKIK